MTTVAVATGVALASNCSKCLHNIDNGSVNASVTLKGIGIPGRQCIQDYELLQTRCARRQCLSCAGKGDWGLGSDSKRYNVSRTVAACGVAEPLIRLIVPGKSLLTPCHHDKILGLAQ